MKLSREQRWIVWPTIVLGVVLLFVGSVERMSYDLPFCFRGNRGVTNDVVIVYVDENSLVELREKSARLLNRTNHTRLLQRLAKDGAKLVFYDFLFSAPDADPRVDRDLAAAIHANLSVVLVGAFQASASKLDLIPPISVLTDSAHCRWGHANFNTDSCFSVRTLPQPIDQMPNAASVAASHLAATENIAALDRGAKRWLNFYGRPGEAFQSRSFLDALSTNLADGYFSNKVVFVGSHLMVGGVGEARDEYATPYTWFGKPLAPGVEIQATAVLNLVNQEWLRRLPPWVEIPVAVIWGYFGSLALVSLCRRGVPRFLLIVLLAVAGAAVLVCFLQWHFRWWTNWLVPVVLQPVLATQFLGVTGFFLAKAQVKKEPYLAFLSYHSDPDGPMANIIKRELKQSGERVFYAPDALGAGHLIELLTAEVERATYFVLIVSKGSLIKCARPDDWVRLELVRAVELRKRIILVFQRGFSFDSVLDPAREPKAAEIDKLAPWRFIKGVEVDSNQPEPAVRELRRLMESEGALANLQRLFTRRVKEFNVEAREASMADTQPPRA
ncbi:MAG: CHASE2 domain-containing protein [Verrucomicrobia bacterium]|nr:CHASE2 domain-containing protein [Verrucomicrobiota bacterium]